MPIIDNKILTPITYVQDLSRHPTPSEAMTYQQLQAKLDQGSEDLRVKHNSLIDDIITSNTAKDTSIATAVTTANNAVTTANNAVTTANSSDTKADNAIVTANNADVKAGNAISTANDALIVAADAQLGTIANNSLTEAKMANEMKKDIAGGVASYNGFVSSLADMTYQVATGTATVITVPTGTLTNGYAKTFIASANNSGAATTINGKALYKPGTTTAPTLIAGKAYTVWYNTTGNCFFIKASATGTATPAQVLAEVPYSNENDTDLVGTMVNRSGAYQSPLRIDGVYEVGALYACPPKGFYDGDFAGASYLRISEPNHIAANYLAGKTYFGLPGTMPDLGNGYVVRGTAWTDKNWTQRAGTDIIDAEFFSAQIGRVDTTTKYEIGIVNLVPKNIVEGVSISIGANGMTGTAVLGKKTASGPATSDLYGVITITGLSFKPSKILVSDSNGFRYCYNANWDSSLAYRVGSAGTHTTTTTTSGFTMQVFSPNSLCNYEAIQ